MRYGIHEVLVTTLDRLGNPNVAPMGVALSNDLIILRPYINTKTFKNLTEVPEAVINITNDAIMFYRSLYDKTSITFSRAKKVRVPIIEGPIDLYVECIVNNYLISSDRATFYLKPVNIYKGRGSRLAFSRANALLIEILVYLTKVEAKALNPNEALPKIKDLLSTIERLGSYELLDIVKELKRRFAL